MERFELAIVGGGPAGLATGAQAARRGVSHLVLERGEFANTVYRYQRGKFVMAEPARLSLHGELALGFEAGSREAVLERWRDDAAKARVNLRQGREAEVLGIEKDGPGFALRLRDGGALQADKVVVAIGMQGNLRRFGVPGDDLPHVSYQLDDPAAFRERRIVVVGVGDAGIENALALAEHGNDVTVVNRRSEFDRAKARNRQLIEQAIQAGEIEHLTEARVREFRPGAMVLTVEGEEVLIEADLVIGRLGALPPRGFLESVGVEFPSEEREAIPLVSDRFESNVPGLHLIGAIVGRPLIKACLNQGYEVVEHILGNPVVPADEPMLREILGPIPGTVAEIVERIRETVPVFTALTPIQLREFLVDSRVVAPGAGEAIYERNEFSDSFFSILEGEVEAIVPAAGEDLDADRGDASIEERRFVLGPGEFFGEGSLLSGRRRAGSMRARGPSVLIETQRMAMQKQIQSVTAVAAVIDGTAIARRLEVLIPELSAEARGELARAAEIESFDPGEALFREGDPPDGLHLIRRGSVVIARERDGREVPVNYVQAGNYVGEVALLHPEGRRSATVRAMVLTETIRVPTDAMRRVTELHPELREAFARRAREQQIQTQRTLADERSSDLVEFLVTKGGQEATDLLLIDEALCIRCDNCEKACADTHQGISRLDREAGPRYANIHLPTACQHCENPRCMLDCPPDAIRRHPNGEVYIQDTCIGCGNCAENCPYDVIQMAAIGERKVRGPLWRLLFGEPLAAEPDAKPPDAREVAVKCDLCRQLPVRRSGEPRAACVAACPTGAIVRVRPQDFIQEILVRRS